MNLRDLAGLLSKKGLKYAFGITGGGKSLKFIDELEKKGVTFINVSHESSAAIIAGASNRVKPNSALSISIKGPGLTNSIGGISYNFFENIPSISVSEAYDSNITQTRMHKRINHNLILKQITRKVLNLDSLSNQIENELEKNTLNYGSPIHIELSTGRVNNKIHEKSEIPRNDFENKFNLLIDRICKSKKPILILGSSIINLDLKRKIEDLSIPIFTTAAGRGLINEELSQSAGIFTSDGQELSNEKVLFQICDLIIAIGLSLNEITGELNEKYPFIFFEFEDNFRNNDLKFKENKYLNLVQKRHVIEIINNLKKKDWDYSQLIDNKKLIYKELTRDEWLPAICFREINKLKYPFSLIIDTGNFCTIAEHIILITNNRKLYASNNGRFMGASIPSAIGVSLIREGEPIFCLLGEGGMQTYPSELKIIKNKKLPICIIYLSDGYYSSVRGKGSQDISINAVKISNPSWIEVVKSIGIDSYICENKNQFCKFFNSWSKSKPIFLECRFDSQKYRNMTSKLR